MTSKVKKDKKKRVPKGFEVLEETLAALDQKMREAESEDTEKKRKAEALWPIFRIHHQKSRYVYEMFYKKKEITREVYNYCVEQKIVDAALIAKWKKAGYERVCCLRCIQPRDHNYGTTCICRVPSKDLETSDGEKKDVECTHCGCRGCASGD